MPKQHNYAIYLFSKGKFNKIQVFETIKEAFDVLKLLHTLYPNQHVVAENRQGEIFLPHELSYLNYLDNGLYMPENAEACQDGKVKDN